MVSATFAYLAALTVVVVQGMQTPRHVHQRRDAPPTGFIPVESASADETITLRIAVKERDFLGLEHALHAASSPGSARFSQYLTKDQVNSYTSPSEEAVTVVSSWLESNGLTPSALSPSGNWISLEATVDQANRLLQADFVKYKHEDLASSVVRTLAYSLTPEVSKHILTVHPTVTFPSVVHPPELQAQERGDGRVSATRTTDVINLPASCIRHPDDESAEGKVKHMGLNCFFDRYEIPYASTAEPIPGNAIWIAGFDNTFTSKKDVETYVKSWRDDLPNLTGSFDLVNITGGLNNQLPIGSESGLHTGSMALAIATAPNTPATFMSVGTLKSDDPMVWFIDQVNYLLAMDVPPNVLLLNFPDNLRESLIDPELARSICKSYAQLTARGVTILSSIYGSGVGSPWLPDPCTPFEINFPASCPYITSVGGTYIDVYSSDVPAELADSWNTGGFSSIFPRPDYQQQAVSTYLDTMEDGMYDGLFNRSGRAVPDVALHRIMALTKDAPYGSGSTHVASAVLGGMVALLNEELATAGKSPIGFLNPLLYGLDTEDFRDFTTGKNEGCGFNATMGWDPLSGLGSPIYTKLRANLGL